MEKKYTIDGFKASLCAEFTSWMTQYMFINGYEALDNCYYGKIPFENFTIDTITNEHISLDITLPLRSSEFDRATGRYRYDDMVMDNIIVKHVRSWGGADESMNIEEICEIIDTTTNESVLIRLLGIYDSYDGKTWSMVGIAEPYEFKETRYKFTGDKSERI